MKASALFGAAWEHESVDVLWQDAGRAFCRLKGDVPNANRHAFVPLVSAAERPMLELITRLTHEYELSTYLSADWALRPRELVREGGRTMLVVDYAGGEPLDRLMGQPMEVGRLLRLAVALSDALGQLHGRGLIHKDIKPANVIVDAAGGHIWLTGFGVASRLPRERQAPAPPEVIAGTPAYMAPEQTGRMNRSVDARSDLYSLGVTLYQMATGVLPFAAAGPDGAGALPYRASGRATRRADSRRASGHLGRDHEAARKNAGGPIPDRRRCQLRPATVPGGVSVGVQHRALRSRHSRRARCPPHSRTAVRARTERPGTLRGIRACRDRRPAPSSCSSPDTPESASHRS